MYIGFGYKAGCGKDLACSYLVENHGFTRIAFADSLKSLCAEVFGISYDKLYDSSKKAAPFRTPIFYTQHKHHEVLSALSDLIGQDVTSLFSDSGFVGQAMRTPREVLQFIGTDVAQWVDSSIWVRCAERKAKQYTDVCFSDVRFKTEAEAVLKMGGACVLLERGTALKGSTSLHRSETEMDSWGGWTHRIENNQTKQFLYDSLERIVREMR